jgi:hypothetical protein
MKILTLLALFTAFTSPAIGGVVSSKKGGNVYCAGNQADHVVKKTKGVEPSSSGHSADAGSGR